MTTELGACTNYLGIRVERTESGMFLSQEAFARKVVEMAGMQNAKPTPAPLPLSHALYEKPGEQTNEDRELMNKVPYSSTLGSLLYLATRTRPDIATAVSMLAKFQSNPARAHWRAMKHVVRYIKGTVQYGIEIPSVRIFSAELCGWCDADLARDQDTRRSRSGYMLTFNGGTISWGSRLQKAVALSTAEAEFDALTQAVREAVWTRRILAELGISSVNPTTI